MVMEKIDWRKLWNQNKLKAIEYWNEFFQVATSLEIPNIRKYLLIYFSWMSFFLFLSFSFLVEKNPFSLLIPFQLFALPLTEHRTNIKIFVSDGEKNIFSSDRLVWMQDSLQEDIRTILEEIGRPPYFSNHIQAEDKIASSKLRRLPNLGVALISIWIVDNGQTLILDFSNREIEREMSKYRFPKTNYEISEGEEGDDDVEVQSSIESYYSAPSDFIDSKTLKEIEEKKLTVFSLVLECIEKSIFTNYPKINKIQFKVNGKNEIQTGLFSKMNDPREKKI
jgi:hypothetical protein